jgi:hypothetical protein
MTTPGLIDRSPLAAARLCSEDPSAAVHGSAGYRALSPANAAAVDALLRRVESDPDLSCRVLGLVRSLKDVPETHQGILVGALAGGVSADDLGRLQMLGADPEFRRMMPLEADRQASDVVGRTAFPGVDTLVRQSGAPAHAPEKLSLAGGVELGAHAVEVVIDVVAEQLVHAGVVTNSGFAIGAAGVCVGAAGIVAVGAGLYGIAEAHHRGEEWGAGVARGQGFVAQMGHFLRGDDPVTGRGPRGDGAVAADRFWEALTPAQRVEMRSVEDVGAVLGALSASVERLTIAGASGAS